MPRIAKRLKTKEKTKPGTKVKNKLKTKPRTKVKNKLKTKPRTKVKNKLKTKVKTKINTKTKIPKAVREQVWIKFIGRRFNSKCYINWCKNNINVFNFHVGHNIPESKGGTLDLNNLRPICSRCNLSMSNNYTITEWDKLNSKKNKCIIL